APSGSVVRLVEAPEALEPQPAPAAEPVAHRSLAPTDWTLAAPPTGPSASAPSPLEAPPTAAPGVPEEPSSYHPAVLPDPRPIRPAPLDVAWQGFGVPQTPPRVAEAVAVRLPQERAGPEAIPVSPT